MKKNSYVLRSKNTNQNTKIFLDNSKPCHNRKNQIWITTNNFSEKYIKNTVKSSRKKKTANTNWE